MFPLAWEEPGKLEQVVVWRVKRRHFCFIAFFLDTTERCILALSCHVDLRCRCGVSVYLWMVIDGIFFSSSGLWRENPTETFLLNIYDTVQVDTRPLFASVRGLTCRKCHINSLIACIQFCAYFLWCLVKLYFPFSVDWTELTLHNQDISLVGTCLVSSFCSWFFCCSY